jgi:hypothetical protein
MKFNVSCCECIDNEHLKQENKEERNNYLHQRIDNMGWKKTKYGYLIFPEYSIIFDVYAKKFNNGYSLKSKGVILVSGITKFKPKYIVNDRGEISTRLYKIKNNILQ